MSLVAILNKTFETESIEKVKKEMKEKILIASFFAMIMLLVPFTTAVARNTDIDTIKENRMFAVKLTTKELEQIRANFKDMIKDSFALHQAVDKAFAKSRTSFWAFSIICFIFFNPILNSPRSFEISFLFVLCV